MKLRKLLKFLLVFLVFAAIFRLQFRDTLPVKAIQAVLFTGATIQPVIPLDHDPSSEKPCFQKDLIRLEIFLLFLVLLSRFSYIFNIFQLKPIRIWIPEKEIPDRHFFRKFKSRAPPFL